MDNGSKRAAAVAVAGAVVVGIWAYFSFHATAAKRAIRTPDKLRPDAPKHGEPLPKDKLLQVLHTMLDNHPKVIARWHLIETEVAKMAENKDISPEDIRGFLIFQYHQVLQSVFSEVLVQHDTTEAALTIAKDVYASDPQVQELVEKFPSLTQALSKLGLDPLDSQSEHTFSDSSDLLILSIYDSVYETEFLTFLDLTAQLPTYGATKEKQKIRDRDTRSTKRGNSCMHKRSQLSTAAGQMAEKRVSSTFARLGESAPLVVPKGDIRCVDKTESSMDGCRSDDRARSSWDIARQEKGSQETKGDRKESSLLSIDRDARCEWLQRWLCACLGSHLSVIVSVSCGMAKFRARSHPMARYERKNRVRIGDFRTPRGRSVDKGPNVMVLCKK
eukprot:g129.t1